MNKIPKIYDTFKSADEIEKKVTILPKDIVETSIEKEIISSEVINPFKNREMKENREIDSLHNRLL